MATVWPGWDREGGYLRCLPDSPGSGGSRRSDLPYWCPACRKAFSVRIGTALERSKVPLRKWVFAIYLEMTSLKGVSSMKLHRDIKVTQKTAWFMLHRIREAWAQERIPLFTGPVEVDETFIGGKRKNMSNTKRKELKHTGRGPVGKAIVVGAKDRESNNVTAKVVHGTDKDTLQGFIRKNVELGAQVYTDDHGGYEDMQGFRHESVKHSVSEYVRDQAHTNGLESFWSMLNRGYQGVYHHMSEKHLHRYVAEFAGRHNIRREDTMDQMAAVVTGMVGKRLMYSEFISGADGRSH